MMDVHQKQDKEVCTPALCAKKLSLRKNDFLDYCHKP